MDEQKIKSDAETILLGSLKIILCNLRSTVEYGKELGNFIASLELSEDISHAMAEALIILAADNLGNSLKRDVALAALGLVRGCSRLEQPNKIKINARKAVSWRRIKFLLTSNYFQDGEEYRQCEAALQAIENGKSHKIKKTLDKLSGNDKLYIEEIAGIINEWYFQDALKKQLKKATEKYPSSPGAQHIDLDKLPTLINLRDTANGESSNMDNIRQGQEQQENLPHEVSGTGSSASGTLEIDNRETGQTKVTPDEISMETKLGPTEEIRDEIKDEGKDDNDIRDKPSIVPTGGGGTEASPSPTEGESKDMPNGKGGKKRKLDIVKLVIVILGMASCIAVGIIAGSVYTLINMNSDRARSNNLPIDEILISPCNLNPTMRVREKKTISVESRPKGSDINKLEFDDHETDVLETTLRDGDLILIAYDKWDEDNHDARITLEGGIAASVDINVTIEPDPADKAQKNIVTEKSISPDDGSGEYK